MFNDRTHPQDKERQALFYIIAGNDDLYIVKEITSMILKKIE